MIKRNDRSYKDQFIAFVMLQKFQQFIRSEKLFSPRDRILLAVSGGMDSCAMAWLFHKSGFHFGIAHCNFGLRGMESDGDEFFVRELSAKYEVPFYCKNFETEKFARSKGISIQMAARELRFEWFEQLRKNEGYQFIAVAHHKDDELETFIINLFRGAGITGLAGYSPLNGSIVRPMLFTCREEIEKLVKKNRIGYREDSSNRTDDYLRNRIRNRILPELRNTDPNAGNAIKTTIGRIKNDEKIFRQIIEEKRNECISEKKGVVFIDIDNLSALAAPEAYLFEFLYPFGFSGDIIKQIWKSAGRQAGKTFFSTTHRIVKDRDHLLISRLIRDSEKLKYLVNREEKEISVPLKMKFTVSGLSGRTKISVKKDVALFDLDKMQFPLIIRKWKHGDYFYPFGMKGKKKLSDFFRDQKFSLIDKENTWLLCSGKDIVWVIGHRNDNRYRITNGTKKIFRAELTGH